MSQNNKNKQSHTGSTPSFKVPNAAKLAFMGLLSSTSALPTAAIAQEVSAPLVAVDDHYVTPVNSVLTTNGTTVKTLANNDTYNGSVISSLDSCPTVVQEDAYQPDKLVAQSNSTSQLQITVLTPPQHGNVQITQSICDNDSTYPNTFGSFQYTPVDGYTGTDSFVYQLSYGNGETSNATASILIGQQFTASGGALGATLLVPLAAAGLARRRKKKKTD